MAGTFPRVNAPIEVRDSDGRSFRSRVEDSSHGVLWIARPFDLPATEVVEVGTELQLTWAGVHGLAVLPVLLRDVSRVRRVPLWVVEAIAEGWTEQRRECVRVRPGGPVTLRVRAGEPVTVRVPTGEPMTLYLADVDPVPARLADVSEAGLRCGIKLPDAGDVAPDSHVVCRFRLAGTQFDIPGRVKSRTDDVAPPRLAHVVVLFDQPVAQADLLRRQVFAEQLHQRRFSPTQA